MKMIIMRTCVCLRGGLGKGGANFDGRRFCLTTCYVWIRQVTVWLCV